MTSAAANHLSLSMHIHEVRTSSRQGLRSAREQGTKRRAHARTRARTHARARAHARTHAHAVAHARNARAGACLSYSVRAMRLSHSLIASEASRAMKSPKSSSLGELHGAATAAANCFDGLARDGAQLRARGDQRGSGRSVYLCVRAGQAGGARGAMVLTRHDQKEGGTKEESDRVGATWVYIAHA
eukprot:2427939-Pleurochrysis_carterae.AAC.3